MGGELASQTFNSTVITGFKTRDVRFQTSLDQTGSDAMNDVGDYSAAFCILQTDSPHVS